MIKPKKLIGVLSNEILFEAIKTCANLPEVRREVFKNHDNNQWWPANIEDWRLRMLVAGWSTRVSYNMISTYKQVVSVVNKIGYDNLCTMSDTDMQKLIGPLGLFNARIQYFKSFRKFVKEWEGKTESLLEMSNDDFIELFMRKVKGASYNVAQCAALYGKGYHCGIFPVDSGMKDMLGPCLGLHLPRGPAGYEVMRKHIEKMITSHFLEYYNLALETGYRDLALPKKEAPIWWAHLILIYFKRLYCNRRNSRTCPLRTNSKIGKYIGFMCDRLAPQLGGFQYVVLEGVDKVGKTMVAGELKKMGYSVIHSSYNSNHENISQHYQTLISTALPPVVFDRIFISEITYGCVMRKHSRLSDREFKKLLQLLSEKSCVVLYFKEEKDIIRKRLLLSSDNSSELLNCLDKLFLEYDKCMEKISNYLPVYEIRPTTVPKRFLLEYILQIVGL